MSEHKKSLGVAYAVKKKNGPKMVGSDAFSTRRRDEADKADDQIDSFKPEEGPQKQPSKVMDEEQATKSGPSTPSLKMKMMAEGGMVDEERDEEQHASIASAIMARKKYAEGGMVDIASNGKEDANMMDELNEAALKENYDSDLMDVSQPMDSNEHGHELSDEDMRSMSKIQKIMHRMRK